MAEGGNSWGKSRRLERLRTPAGAYLWLAMDHGLTHGRLDGITDVAASLELAESAHLTGVVVNRGLATMLAPSVRAGLVLQTFGRPALDSQPEARVATCRVDDALRLAADAVAVQLDLGASGLSHAVHAVSLTISDAARFELPVLLMVTPSSRGEPFEAVADALRISMELGADLIKVALPAGADSADPGQFEVLRLALRYAPPVLLAGGERRHDFVARLILARDLGFGGACIGRSVFQDPEPEAVLEEISAVFEAPSSASGH